MSNTWHLPCTLSCLHSSIQGTNRFMSAAAGSIELLAARSLALLRTLTEFEQRPFLDQASDNASTRELARHTATRATHFAGLHSKPPQTIQECS